MGVHPEEDVLSHDLEFRLDAARRSAIWLKPGEKNSSRSRLGGLPELAPGVAWPRQGSSGTPLHFLAQIDLAELPQGHDEPSLPRHGLLSFFGDIEEEMLWRGEDERGGMRDPTRVVYSQTPGVSTSPPDDIPEIGHAWGEMAEGRAKGVYILPEYGLSPVLIDSYPGIQLPSPYTSELRSWNEAAFRRIAASVGLPESRPRGLRLQQMLGAGLNNNCNADATQKAGGVLLLQLEYDADANPLLVCDGQVHFWIDEQDLAARRFDRAWAYWSG